jgi:hypothetical protein
MRVLGGFFVAVALWLLAVAPAQAQMTPPISWNDPVAVAPGHDLIEISCPSASFCAAIDTIGNIVTTTDPTSPHWRVTPVVPGGQFSGISCASPSLCAVIDDSANIHTSADPTGGPAAWQKVHLPDRRDRNGQVSPPRLTGISCPASDFCMAVEGGGYGYTTTQPIGGAWTINDVDNQPCPYEGGRKCVWGEGGLLSVSCVSSAFCAATNDQAMVLTSTEPHRGADAWRAFDTRFTDPCHQLGCSTFLVDVSCASTTLCAVVGPYGALAASTDAAGNQWKTAPQTNGSKHLTAVSCVAEPLCVAVYRQEYGAQGTLESMSPGSGQWIEAEHDPRESRTPGLRDVACLSASLCILVDAAGNAIIGEPSAERVQASMSGELVPTGRAARIAALLRRKTYATPFKALLPGNLTVRWRARTRRGNLLTIASARHRFITAGEKTKKLRLTHRGADLLRGTKRLNVTATATLQRPNRPPVVAEQQLTLRR